MRLRRITLVWLLVALLSVSLAGGAYATSYRITALGDPANQYGWQTHFDQCWGAQGGILSFYNKAAVGNPGPAPGACLGFECPENGTLGGTDQPGNVWVGTDKYVGTKIADIKKMDYWAIVDWRGVNTTSMYDGNHIKVVNEWLPGLLSSQPPAIVLIAYKAPPGNMSIRTLIYRPWSAGTNPDQVGFGPYTVPFDAVAARRHRVWQQYDATTEGLWYVNPVTLTPSHPTGMYTWAELVAMYPNAALATPAVDPYPVWGEGKAPIPTSFNVHMGAMANANNDWQGVGGQGAWYNESYWARGAADLVTFEKYTDPGHTTSVSETFDFDLGTDVPPSYIRPLSKRALNNRAVSDQTVYMPGMWPPDVLPNRRTRARASGAVSIPWAQGAVESDKMNAVQRAGAFGISNLESVPNGETVNMFVLYGKVCASPAGVNDAFGGRWFYVDDGAGLKVKCYCPDGNGFSPLGTGNYVKMVGTLQGNNPNEWYWNQFHYVEWKPGFPVGCAMSQPWPWEFMTYTWNVIRLN